MKMTEKKPVENGFEEMHGLIHFIWKIRGSGFCFRDCGYGHRQEGFCIVKSKQSQDFLWT